MTQYLRQSTASQEIILGRFLDSTNGNDEETGLTIANTDIKIWKSGATTLANKNSGGGTHIANGIYYAVLDATDTDTIGPLEVHTHVTGALATKLSCVVLDEAVYDVMFGTTAPATTGNLTSSTVGTVTTVTNNVNALLANGAHGGIAAVLTLERVVVASTTTNQPAITLTGNGSGAGMRVNGGATGHGIHANAGLTSGDGIRGDGSGNSGDGIAGYGNGSGKAGIIGYSTGTSGAGILGYGAGANTTGIKATAGPYSLYGMEITSLSSTGLRIAGAVAGHGIDAIGGATGHGINANGGATNGTSGINATSQATNANGMTLTGKGTGHGLATTGGATGHGLVATGGATSGDGIRAIAATSGDGIEAVGAGGGYDINADIQGNLSGTVGSLVTLDEDSTTVDLDATIRAAVGLASANLDTQLDAMPTAVENADAILDRDMSTGTDSGSATVRTVRQALRFLRNKWAVSGTTLTVYKEDDTTASWAGTVSTDASADPVTGNDPASS